MLYFSLFLSLSLSDSLPFQGMREGKVILVVSITDRKHLQAKAIEDVYPLRYPLYLGSAASQEFWRQRKEGVSIA